MFRAFAPIIRSTRPRLAANGILSYLQMGGGVKSRRVGRVCGADASINHICCITLVSFINFHYNDARSHNPQIRMNLILDVSVRMYFSYRMLEKLAVENIF
jgi:hypothetical protein